MVYSKFDDLSSLLKGLKAREAGAVLGLFEPSFVRRHYLSQLAKMMIVIMVIGIGAYTRQICHLFRRVENT